MQTSKANRLPLRSLGVGADASSELTRVRWKPRSPNRSPVLTKLVVNEIIEHHGTTDNCIHDVDVCLKGIDRLCQKLDIVSRERERCEEVGEVLPQSKDIELRAHEVAS